LITEKEENVGEKAVSQEQSQNSIGDEIQEIVDND
jgi:hypothetical protein